MAMRILPVLLVLGVLGSGCSSSPKKIPIRCHPPEVIVVILDDPAASALLYAKESEKLLKKVVKLLAKELAPELVDKLAKYSLDELVARIVCWLHLDKIPTAAVAEVREIFGAVPRGIREELLGTLGVDDFGVSPMELKRKTLKTYAILGWAPGFKAEVKTLHPGKSPDEITITLAPKKS